MYASDLDIFPIASRDTAVAVGDTAAMLRSSMPKTEVRGAGRGVVCCTITQFTLPFCR